MHLLLNRLDSELYCHYWSGLGLSSHSCLPQLLPTKLNTIPLLPNRQWRYWKPTSNRPTWRAGRCPSLLWTVWRWSKQFMTPERCSFVFSQIEGVHSWQRCVATHSRPASMPSTPPTLSSGLPSVSSCSALIQWVPQFQVQCSHILLNFMMRYCMTLCSWESIQISKSE